MKAVLRRTDDREPRRRVLALGDVALRRDAREVTVAGEPSTLTAKEFDLLAFLLEHPGIVLLARPAARPRLGHDATTAGRAPSTSTSPSCAGSSAGPTLDPHGARRGLQGRPRVIRP